MGFLSQCCRRCVVIRDMLTSLPKFKRGRITRVVLRVFSRIPEQGQWLSAETLGRASSEITTVGPGAWLARDSMTLNSTRLRESLVFEATDLVIFAAQHTARSRPSLAEPPHSNVEVPEGSLGVS
jgi:hypothetical protein